MTDIYNEILDFVSLAKKLEYALRNKYEYRGKSIFRGKIDKQIPYKGELEFEGVKYEFFFHGSGIDFKSEHRLLHYNFYAGKDGLGVYFTPQAIIEISNLTTEELEKEIKYLLNQNLIKQWMPEIPLSKVYYLV